MAASCVPQKVVTLRPTVLLLSGLLILNLVASFQLAPSHRSHISTTLAIRPRAPSPTLLKFNIADGNDFVSPNHIKLLRKEASKRRARKKMPRVSLPSDETNGPFSAETLSLIFDKLAQNELVEIRSISKDRKKTVFDVTQQLATDLGVETGKLVTVVESKGFAATLYCPGDDDLEGKIILRTSYREGQWAKKPKPKRDNRGQIIKGEYEYYD